MPVGFRVAIVVLHFCPSNQDPTRIIINVNGIYFGIYQSEFNIYWAPL